MAQIFLAFANSRSSPLPTLTQEEETIYAYLSKRYAEGHFTLHRDNAATLESVSEYLIRFRETVQVFHFSGHAERDALILQDQEADSEGIAELLGQCPNLQLIVLNGCSTVGQVEQLLTLPNQPAVIATHAPVEDYSATRFSQRFYQALCEQYAELPEAFDLALAAAKLNKAEAINAARGRKSRKDSPQEAPVWELFLPEEQLLLQHWKLPMQAAVEQEDILPNQYLIEGLLESLAPYDSDVKAVQKPIPIAGIPGVKQKSPERKKKNAILKCLPFPISVHLQKLLAKRRASMEGHDFYDEFGLKRFKQLLYTYNTVIELPSFVLLSQIWDALADQQSLRLKPHQIQLIKDYCHAPYQERLRLQYFPLLQELGHCLKQHQIPFFVPELKNLALEEDPDFYNAFSALEIKKKQLAQNRNYSDRELVRECIETEEKLSIVLNKLSFLAAYSLVSVRNIDVLRNRQVRNPSYLHRLVRLVQHFSDDPMEEVELLEDFLDNASILLMKKESLSDDSSFLNLTPFVIDENAYVEKAEDHKLFYFHQLQAEHYYFKHIYKPEDALKDSREGSHLEPLKYQFDVFWKLLSQQKGGADD